MDSEETSRCNFSGENCELKKVMVKKAAPFSLFVLVPICSRTGIGHQPLTSGGFVFVQFGREEKRSAFSQL